MSKLYIDLPKAVELILGEIEKAGADHIHTVACANVTVEWRDGYDENWESAIDHIVPRSVKGSCIVGRALIAGGIEPETFVALEMISSTARGVLDRFRAEGFIEGYTYGAVEYLSSVQRNQDAQLPWGAAHAAGLQRVGGFLWESLTEDEKAWFDFRENKE